MIWCDVFWKYLLMICFFSKTFHFLKCNSFVICEIVQKQTRITISKTRIYFSMCRINNYFHRDYCIKKDTPMRCTFSNVTYPVIWRCDHISRRRRRISRGRCGCECGGCSFLNFGICDTTLHFYHNPEQSSFSYNGVSYP